MAWAGVMPASTRRLELEAVVAVPVAAGVGAHGDPHAGPQRPAEALARGARASPGPLLLERRPERAVPAVDGEGRHVPGAARAPSPRCTRRRASRRARSCRPRPGPRSGCPGRRARGSTTGTPAMWASSTIASTSSRREDRALRMQLGGADAAAGGDLDRRRRPAAAPRAPSRERRRGRCTPAAACRGRPATASPCGGRRVDDPVRRRDDDQAAVQARAPGSGPGPPPRGTRRRARRGPGRSCSPPRAWSAARATVSAARSMRLWLW